MLTPQQTNFFHTFGFLKLPGLFREEFPRIEASFHEVWGTQGGGHDGSAHDGMQRSALVPFIDKHEYLSGLIDDPRIDGIASATLGDDYNYMFSDGNFFVGPTFWHSDRYYNKPYLSLKVAFYLDRVTRDTGCLRVLPGTHHVGDRFGNSVQEAMPHSERQILRADVGDGGAGRSRRPAGERAGRCPRLQPQDQALRLRRKRGTPDVHHRLPAAAPR